MQDHHRAFYLSVALACIDEIKRTEPKNTTRSLSRYKKLCKLEGDIVKATDLLFLKRVFLLKTWRRPGNWLTSSTSA